MVIPTLETGGAQKLLESMVPLMQNDHQVKIVVFKRLNSDIERNLSSNKVPISFLNIGTHSPMAILKLWKFLKWADVVHTHLFPVHYYTAVSNLFLHKPHVFTEHSTYNKRRAHSWLRPIEKFIYNKINQTVSITDATKNALIEWLKTSNPAKMSKVILNGIDLNKYKNALIKTPEEIFGRSGIPVLMISRFTKAKDHKTVLRALKIIKDPNVFVVFVGDGDLKSDIEKYAETLHLQDRVMFLGARNDIPELIKASKIGVQSSHWEGFGLTAVEMMAGGIPVIASNVKGLADIVGSSGLIFEKENHEMLACHIKNLMEDEILYKKLQTQGYETAANYSIENTVSNYLELYKSLLSHSSIS